MTTVAEILRHKADQAVTVAPTTRIADLVRLLAARPAGAALVADHADQLLGIVSERDVLGSLAANGARTLEMTAGQLMTRPIRTVSPQTGLSEAMQIMAGSQFRHLPALENGVLLGLISMADVVRACVMQEQGALAA